jgi:hypothetical protein
MALTVAQLRTHLGAFWIYTVQEFVVTDAHKDALAQMMQTLTPAGKAYIQNGPVGTQAERQEAMVTLRDGAWEAITGVNPTGNAPLLHYLQNHWHATET